MVLNKPECALTMPEYALLMFNMFEYTSIYLTK